MKYILWLKDIGKKDRAVVGPPATPAQAWRAGGKGVALGEMLHAGFPVPPGFVVLTSAFEAPRAALSQNAAKSILAAFKKLKTKFVAVRSSATAEDSLSASWAGQLESYLNIEEKNLLVSIEKCRQSINSPRAKAYRKQKKLGKSKISVAVIVQKMIPAEFSGVCFTANPVTGDRNEMIIETGRGLGEALVGGKITPATYTINKKSIGFGNPYIKLVRICLKIEKFFKYPQDIEWAFAKGKFYILQSRPITTLDR
ncbi:MAG: PEP/pyruvate-binding domain-containing protein [Candidatus Azambacteria bacterium]|nr:PEP/pyruvate-binding domain-containing protein [Candidatus Azambacteria bacterium]